MARVLGRGSMVNATGHVGIASMVTSAVVVFVRQWRQMATLGTGSTPMFETLPNHLDAAESGREKEREREQVTPTSRGQKRRRVVKLTTLRPAGDVGGKC